MPEYVYAGITSAPQMEQIHVDVAASTMTNKAIGYCRWDEEDQILRINFDTALSAADESELDSIVASNT